MSTFTGGPCESAAPQVKQYLASSALVLPQTLHIAMLQTLPPIGIKYFLTVAKVEVHSVGWIMT